MRPEAEAGVGDEEDFFAVDGVPTVGERVGVVVLHHFVEAGVCEADAFNLFAAQFAGTPGDSGSAF